MKKAQGPSWAQGQAGFLIARCLLNGPLQAPSPTVSLGTLRGYRLARGIDDHSEDASAVIAHQAADGQPARVIQPPLLSTGWCGKTWALHHDGQASTGELLLFPDADSEPAPQCLERLLACHGQRSLLFNLVGRLGGPLVGTQALARNGLIHSTFALQLQLISRRVGRFSWNNHLFQVPVLLLMRVVLLAILNLERGEVAWKGRLCRTP